MSIAVAAITGPLIATPALAQTGLSVPEPNAAVLFALGVAGLLIGRRAARPPIDD